MDDKRNTVEVANLRRFAGAWLASFYLLTATPAAPAFATLLGSADRSHHVALQQTADGVQVVLRHDCINSADHRHGVVARALTLMAQRPISGHPDHVIQFGTSAASVAVLITSVLQNPASELLLSRDSHPHQLQLTAALAVHSPAPSEQCSSSFRSTVLLL